MVMNPLERATRTAEAIALLRSQGPSLSLTVTRLLVDIGFDAPTAWKIVEQVIRDEEERASEQA